MKKIDAWPECVGQCDGMALQRFEMPFDALVFHVGGCAVPANDGFVAQPFDDALAFLRVGGEPEVERGVVEGELQFTQ